MGTIFSPCRQWSAKNRAIVYYYMCILCWTNALWCDFCDRRNITSCPGSIRHLCRPIVDSLAVDISHAATSFLSSRARHWLTGHTCPNCHAPHVRLSWMVLSLSFRHSDCSRCTGCSCTVAVVILGKTTFALFSAVPMYSCIATLFHWPVFV